MTDAITFSAAEARYTHADRYDRGTRYNERHLQDVRIKKEAINRFAVRFPDSDDGHVVDLEATAEGYRGTCTCGDFQYRDTVCKHLWAVFATDEAPVIDTSDDRTPAGPRRMTDGGAVATTATRPTRNGRAPSYGDLVEAAVADRFALELIDAEFYDARATEATPALEAGTPIQVKGAQRRTKNGTDANGNQSYTKGRFRAWREELLELLADDGRYIVAVYDADGDDVALTHVRTLTPEQMGEAAEGSWYDGHRPGKGESAKITWTRLVGRDPDV